MAGIKINRGIFRKQIL